LPRETRVAIERAVSWYWGGQLVSDAPYAVLYEYMCYWNVIEIFAHKFGKAKTEDKETEEAIKKRIENLVEEEDLQDILMAFRYRRALKQKVKSFLEKIMVKEKATEVFQKIFKEKKMATLSMI
jgi:hypothetical protein